MTPDANPSLTGAGPTDGTCGAPLGASGEPCGCNTECVAGAQCIEALDPSSAGWVSVFVCTAIASGRCFHGVALDDRCTNGAFCLPPRRDPAGLCLTPPE